MKTIKLSFIKNQHNLSKSCSIINLRIKYQENENTIELGNLIRKKLLKDTVRLKTTKN